MILICNERKCIFGQPKMYLIELNTLKQRVSDCKFEYLRKCGSVPLNNLLQTGEKRSSHIWKIYVKTSKMFCRIASHLVILWHFKVAIFQWLIHLLEIVDNTCVFAYLRKLIKSKNDELLKIILLSVHMCEFITVVCPHFENYEAIFQSWWPKDSVAICLICIFLWVQVFLKNAKKAKQKVTILNNSPCVCI